MTRILSAFGGLCLMALILLAQVSNLLPPRAGGATAPAREPAAASDPYSAIDDLASWPVAAGR